MYQSLFLTSYLLQVGKGLTFSGQEVDLFLIRLRAFAVQIEIRVPVHTEATEPLGEGRLTLDQRQAKIFACLCL